MKTTLLIDADSTAYHHAAANQKMFDFGDGPVITHLADLATVIPEVDDEVNRMADKLKADEVIICLSCPSLECWRVDVLPTYKQNRTAPKPVLIAGIKDHFREHYKVLEKPGMEADDICGIFSTHPYLVPGIKVVSSIDKDLKTIPGWLYNPQKDRKARLISQQEADYWHLYQTLVGDTTDGYTGCPGVGPDKATYALERILKRVPVHREITRGINKGQIRTTWEDAPAEDLWEVVVSHFVSRGYTEADALQQARVARICRHTDYDFKTKEVKLWNPSGITS